MDLKDKMSRFNKRWSVTSIDSYEEAFIKFKIRMLNIFKKIDNYIPEKDIKFFCQYYGIKEIWHGDNSGYRSWSTNIIDRLNTEKSEKEFYRLIELIFSLDIHGASGSGGRTVYGKNILLKEVVSSIELSEVNVAISVTDDEVILYPKGEKMLDKDLVDAPLSFLNKQSSDHFTQALQFYEAKVHIKSAESLRRTLEEFLRYKMKNDKGFNANILELQTKLKSDNRDAEVRNIIRSTLNYLDQYFNENSKHNDGEINDVENEFLIYQVGLLARYINNCLK